MVTDQIMSTISHEPKKKQLWQHIKPGNHIRLISEFGNVSD